jgi:hypothetical protein
MNRQSADTPTLLKPWSAGNRAMPGSNLEPLMSALGHYRILRLVDPPRIAFGKQFW